MIIVKNEKHKKLLMTNKSNTNDQIDKFWYLLYILMPTTPLHILDPDSTYKFWS